MSEQTDQDRALMYLATYIEELLQEFPRLAISEDPIRENVHTILCGKQSQTKEEEA